MFTSVLNDLWAVSPGRAGLTRLSWSTRCDQVLSRLQGGPGGAFPGLSGVSDRSGSPWASYGQISGLGVDDGGRLVDAGFGVGL